MAENKLVKKDIGTQVLDRVNQLCEAGFKMAPDFSAINAIKATMLMLQQVVDKNKRPALEVCTSVSIQTALFEMCVQSLDVSKRQAYLLVRGDKLCFQPSYFGHILQVKRLFPDWSPVAHTVREGDEFEYTINPENGKMKLVKHEQKLENLDKDFIGAYMYLPCADGEPELYVMTRKQIMRAWSKSSSQSLQTHKDFDEKMALKTIINSGCTKVINATPDPTYVAPEEDPNNFQDPVGGEETNFVEFEEVKEEHKEVVEEQPKEEPQQPTQEQPADDEF
jgi:recombination protein RecT